MISQVEDHLVVRILLKGFPQDADGTRPVELERQILPSCEHYMVFEIITLYLVNVISHEKIDGVVRFFTVRT